MDSQLMEGITYLERSAPGVSLEQWVFSSLLAARPGEGVAENVSDCKPVINPVISYTLDSQLMEGITYWERSALGVSLDSGPTEGYPSTGRLPETV